MTKHHYVYKSYEEEGREYIGCRSCNCLPEEDTKYFGSFCDKSFKPTGKTILFVCETREEAMEIEIELHNFFNVAVNPQFANKSKQTGTKFDRTGVPNTEKAKKKMSVARKGKYAGENNPMYGVPRTEAQKKANSERMSGEKNPRCRAIIAIEPDGTQRHFWGATEAARELKTSKSNVQRCLKIDQVLKWGKLKGWQFIYENP